MATISGFQSKIITARDGIAYEMPKIIERLKEEIINLNKSQLSEGLDNEGELIGVYSRATELITKAQALIGKNVRVKIAGEPFDFEQTGLFKKGFELDVWGNQLSIFSTANKAPILEAKYPNLYGLTEKNAEIMNYELILPELLKYLRTVIYA